MKSSRSFVAFLALLALAATATARAQDSAAKPATDLPASTLDTVFVYGESESESIVQNPFLAPVEGTKIFAGKRATVIDLDALPKVQANNYRQALALTPGLLFSEETSPLVSLGYRGIGDPHRMQFMQVLKDGIPIHADPFGYPEAYYTPPLDVVDRIEFIRGGGSLMYGAQPGGALNYVTYMPRRDQPFSFRTQNIFGSDNLFSSYTAVDGTSGKVGYYGYYNHRESDGFRTANSDYVLDGAHFKIAYDVDADTRWIFAFDGYEEEHGEPGGLSLANYPINRDQATKFYDRFELRRYAGSAELQHRIQPGTELNVKVWGGYYDRLSRRQAGGGGFGIPAAGLTNTIERQEFYSFGIEPRIRHDWEAFGGHHTLAAGMQFYWLDSPRQDKTGASPAATDGPVVSDVQRDLFYYSFFAENKFTFGPLSITPGFRLESIQQDINSKTLSLAGVTTAARQVEKDDVQPLFGLGIAYELPAQTELYANVSQSYRPTVFTESIVTAPGLTATDTEPGLGWSYELGYRGTPRPWVTFDTSLFLIDIDNRFGVSGGMLRSVGRSINYGWDGALQVDLIGAWDARHGSHHADRLGSLNLYTSISLLNAELDGGPNDGGVPQYAPDSIVRTGLIYGYKDRVKVAFLGTFVDDHKAVDDNRYQFQIPGYMTWDLTAEVKVTKNFSVMAGLNNVFNEDYYARVRSDGIDPAYARNFYLGGAFTF
ncbi:MAG: TonB-dependent receptor [Prosthecobacter sp.]|nr:TonB-dependent receptor [Prosthecobacter sp.]